MPFIEIINPKYRTSVLWNSHLFIFSYRLAPRRAFKIKSTYFLYSVRLLLYINILLI